MSLIQYLSNSELSALDVKITNEFKITIIDNYDEKKIFDKILKHKNKELLCYSAIQMSIIGIGNKNYGKFIYKNKEHEILDIFKDSNILYNIGMNMKLNDDDITPRRLIRLFRHQIHNYIKENKTYSYLWRKYCKVEGYETKIFPGAEHMCKKEDVKILIETYENLDRKLNINICDRIKRVLIARNLMNI